MRVISSLTIFAWLAAFRQSQYADAALRQGCDGAGPKPPLPSVPCIEVPGCESGNKALISGFDVVTPDPNQPNLPPLKTDVSICYSRNGFESTWVLSGKVASDAPNMTTCHASLWEGDAAEFYIAPSAPGAGTTHRYSEIDVGTQTGGMWLGHMYNPSGFNPDPSSYDHLPNCNTSGILTGSFVESTGWVARLFVPYSFVMPNGFKPNQQIPSVWRANFYRWAYSPRQLTGWHNTSCEGNEPCNAPHIPKYFGVLVLV